MHEIEIKISAAIEAFNQHALKNVVVVVSISMPKQSQFVPGNVCSKAPISHPTRVQ
jgi:hypothetical protein